jgi:hypothetical protein
MTIKFNEKRLKIKWLGIKLKNKFQLGKKLKEKFIEIKKIRIKFD